MKALRIKKYIADSLDEEIIVPVVFISMLNGTLPNQAVVTLRNTGFDFEEIINAAKNKQSYKAEAVIDEKGVTKRVELSIS
ncbi:hypothetical protein E3O66_15880 [Salmonella enterica subsp. enterica serovar Oslo]|nr:hypothetical protein [Salmonella enterica subsp. enterica serovar Oslo]ECG6796584.1 hypothetical protein [Salmonella enterica subsp. enterica serovar Oslo]EGM7048176.1 hypothetical protein [Salmonella enterica subsp. enterica serovar Oslo]